jgi:hypothetical protein
MDVMTFLLAINWLKLNESEHVMSGWWILDTQVIRNRVHEIVNTIQSLNEKRRLFGEDSMMKSLLYLLMPFIGKFIQEVRTDPSAKWYDHKSNSAGVLYELAIAIPSTRLKLSATMDTKVSQTKSQSLGLVTWRKSRNSKLESSLAMKHSMVESNGFRFLPLPSVMALINTSSALKLCVLLCSMIWKTDILFCFGFVL